MWGEQFPPTPHAWHAAAHETDGQTERKCSTVGGTHQLGIGDASKAQERLGWEATVLPPELAKIMVDADMARLGGAPEGQF